MSKSKPKNYRRDWLKERNQHKHWKNKYKELEATIKDDNKDLKMSEAKDEYDKAMTDLHKAHDKLVAEIDTLKKDILVYKAALKGCKEKCHRKDAEIAALKKGARLAPGPLRREEAQNDVDNTPKSGFSDEEGEEIMPVEDVDLLKKLKF